jgi:hypothetical protein
MMEIDYEHELIQCHLAQKERDYYKEAILFMALRMMFGGAHCPSLWGLISETMADLGNSLLRHSYWDPTKLYVPIPWTLSKPLSFSDSIPFHQAAELSVPVPLDVNGKIDVYIDNFIGIAPNVGDTMSRDAQAILLAIHSIA